MKYLFRVNSSRIMLALRLAAGRKFLILVDVPFAKVDEIAAWVKKHHPEPVFAAVPPSRLLRTVHAPMAGRVDRSGIAQIGNAEMPCQ